MPGGEEAQPWWWPDPRGRRWARGGGAPARASGGAPWPARPGLLLELPDLLLEPLPDLLQEPLLDLLDLLERLGQSCGALACARPASLARATPRPAPPGSSGRGEFEKGRSGRRAGGRVKELGGL